MQCTAEAVPFLPHILTQQEHTVGTPLIWPFITPPHPLRPGP